MKRIILISCVSRKGTKKAKAMDLYKGPLFENSLAYGQSLKPDKIFILSALHYLLDLDKEIEPYNVTLSNIPNNKRKNGLKVLTLKEKIDWGEKVINQLKLEADLQNDEFIILAGQEYIKPIEGFLSTNNVKKPLDGKRVGERIKFMQNKNKFMLEKLQHLYPNRITLPANINDIPNSGYMVYILGFNNNPIVLGHGQKNRSKVIFDNEIQITSNHLKAIFVRLYNLYGNGKFNRYIISCQNKDEAKIIEGNLHLEIGGNNRVLPIEIRNQLFKGLEPNSPSYLVLEIALRSSFDGLSDIRKWRADGILSDAIWTDISQRLSLN